MKTIALLLVLVGSTAMVTSCGLFCPECPSYTSTK